MGRGGGTHFVRSRSPVVIGLRIPSMPGWSTWGFHRQGIDVSESKADVSVTCVTKAYDVVQCLGTKYA